VTAVHINWQLAVQLFATAAFSFSTVRLWKAGLPYLRAAYLCLTASSAVFALFFLMPSDWHSDWLLLVLLGVQFVLIASGFVFFVIASLRGEPRKIPTLRWPGRPSSGPK
jgi:hypothetical protein